MKFNRRTILKVLLASPVAAVIPALADKKGDVPTEKPTYRYELLNGFDKSANNIPVDNPALNQDNVGEIIYGTIKTGDTIRITGDTRFAGVYRVGDIS